MEKVRSILKPLRVQKIVDPLDKNRKIKVRRYQLLVDYEKLNLRAGSISGLMDYNLSWVVNPSDTLIMSWIDYDAIVYGKVEIQSNVRIMDKAIVRGPSWIWNSDKLTLLSGSTIKDNAIVGYNTIDDLGDEKFVIGGNTHISDNAKINWPTFISNTRIGGDSTVGSRANISGNVTISDNVRVCHDVTLKGNIELRDEIEIRENFSFSGDKIFDGHMTIPDDLPSDEVTEKKQVTDTKWRESHFPSQSDLAKADIRNLSPQAEMDKSDTSMVVRENATKSAVKPGVLSWFDRFVVIRDKIDAYESDIVKIIKYPVMTDLTNEYTVDLMCALNDVQVSNMDDMESMSSLVSLLERKFFMAESNARKIATTQLTDDERKKTADARDLFAIACNEASSEQEKKASFKQGFARLEGVIAVPEKAVTAMREKVGLLELTL